MSPEVRTAVGGKRWKGELSSEDVYLLVGGVYKERKAPLGRGSSPWTCAVLASRRKLCLEGDLPPGREGPLKESKEGCYH